MNTDDGLLYPRLDDETLPFFEACADGRLLAYRCGNCARWWFPPRPVCADCRSTNLSWQPTAGSGRIWSVCRPYPPLLPGYSDHPPANVIVVALSEDPRLRMVGNLLAAAGGSWGDIAYDTITPDEPVRFVSGPVVHGVTLPGWVLT
jgi:uncharacterized OB-fold protein